MKMEKLEGEAMYECVLEGESPSICSWAANQESHRMSDITYTDEELSITLYRESDAEILCEVDSDLEHRKRFDFPSDFVPSIEHAKGVISSWAKGHELKSRFAFAVRNAKTGELVGGCELNPKQNSTANVSYWIHPRHRRKGIASRAVKLLSQEVAPRYGLATLELLTDSDNTASRGVARNCGYTESGKREGKILHLLILQPAAQQVDSRDAFGAPDL